jgi:hypothetical protein
MIAQSIQSALNTLPAEMLKQSGSVFYTGRSAFAKPSDFYILGLNPGGSPLLQASETIQRDLQEWQAPDRERWSAYADACWTGKDAGEHKLQLRLKHMFAQLGLSPRDVPASNVVFVRSQTEALLKSNMSELLAACWPVHEAVMTALKTRIVLALGSTAGRWLRDKIGAHTPAGEFRECNKRRWNSYAHCAGDGRTVITVTHPGRADWCNVASDPTPLVRDVLGRSSAI